MAAVTDNQPGGADTTWSMSTIHVSIFSNILSLVLPCDKSSCVHCGAAMMTSFWYWLIYITYYISTVHSIRMKGTFDDTSVQELSENVDGHYLPAFKNARTLSLDKFANENVPLVSISNFEVLRVVKMNSLSLESMPIFESLPALQKIRITGNNIIHLAENVFNGYSVTVADLAYNEIGHIARGAFTSKLLHIKLRCNKLTQFTAAWFQYPESLKIIDLSGNQIKEIVEDAFKPMTAIAAISLFNNHIATIGVAAFRRTVSLLVLHLGFNNITYLTPRMFENINVHILRVDYNRLSYIPETLLGKINPKLMSIVGNPWLCGCLRNLETRTPRISFLRPRFNFTSAGSVPSCVVPANLADACTEIVDPESQQLYMNALPTVPADFCGAEREYGLLGDYYIQWSNQHYLSFHRVQ